MQKKKKRTKGSYTTYVNSTVRTNWIFNCLSGLKISLKIVLHIQIFQIHKLYNEFISTVTLDTTNF